MHLLPNALACFSSRRVKMDPGQTRICTDIDGLERSAHNRIEKGRDQEIAASSTLIATPPCPAALQSKTEQGGQAGA
jgi:hypothetical protein